MKITNDTVRTKAKECGFDIVGFAEAGMLTEEVSKLDEWLGRGYQAGMSYMERNREKRLDVRNILPSAKSVISLGLNYYTKENYSYDSGKGKVSRYAWGTDYHLIIWEKLARFEEELKQIDPSFESVSYVDTGPVMDKVWAVKAGIGWLGKNTNVINKEIGSWIFLSTVITNAEFEYSAQLEDFCGTCTACIDACPTGAIAEEYAVDSNKCISYLTIENKGEIASEFKGRFEDWIFGCDICQDVCPWNIKFAAITHEDKFFSEDGNGELNLDEILNMGANEFKLRFERSPIKRAKLKGLRRNAEFLLGRK